jgi:hypothetical protein
MGDINEISSANLLRSYTTRPIDIVDLPIKNSDFPVGYVSLPEGIRRYLEDNIL